MNKVYAFATSIFAPVGIDFYLFQGRFWGEHRRGLVAAGYMDSRFLAKAEVFKTIENNSTK